MGMGMISIGSRSATGWYGGTSKLMTIIIGGTGRKMFIIGISLWQSCILSTIKMYPIDTSNSKYDIISGGANTPVGPSGGCEN